MTKKPLRILFTESGVKPFLMCVYEGYTPFLLQEMLMVVPMGMGQLVSRIWLVTLLWPRAAKRSFLCFPACYTFATARLPLVPV